MYIHDRSSRVQLCGRCAQGGLPYLRKDRRRVSRTPSHEKRMGACAHRDITTQLITAGGFPRTQAGGGASNERPRRARYRRLPRPGEPERISPSAIHALQPRRHDVHAARPQCAQHRNRTRSLRIPTRKRIATPAAGNPCPPENAVEDRSGASAWQSTHRLAWPRRAEADASFAAGHLGGGAQTRPRRWIRLALR